MLVMSELTLLYHETRVAIRYGETLTFGSDHTRLSLYGEEIHISNYLPFGAAYQIGIDPARQQSDQEWIGAQLNFGRHW